mmetsp:Transcript_22839/g.45896  ORF Transcript_22839/g.45896 Transcript_22839/m.45896 type:complete len:249 (+) Transcript_22839:278-1024(+)
MLRDSILDVHFPALFVLLLPRQRDGVAEVIGVFFLHLFPVGVVQESVRVRHSEEQPCEALVVFRSLRVLDEKALQEASVRGDAGARAHHDDRCLGAFLRHQHHLSRGSGHDDLCSRDSVTQVVGADTFLRWILFSELWVEVGGTADGQGHRLACPVIAVARRRDRVEACPVRLVPLRIDARGNNARRLALPVGHVSAVIDDNLTGLAGRLGPHDPGDLLNGPRKRLLLRVRVQRQLAPVIVRRSLEVV